jgi:hypothetical protein
MPTPSESPVAVSGKPSKMVELLRKRLRQLLRVVVVLAACVAVAATAFAIWWLNSLNGLPDVGDPFDVAAFRAFRIPDDQNAFAWLRRANQMLTRPPLSVDFRDPRLREWVEASRPAVELFIKAAERPDAMSEPIDADDPNNYPVEREGPETLMWLTILEGERRGASDDPAGAWDCYRAVLRMTAHLRRRGRLTERRLIMNRHAGLRQALATWAADPRTTTQQVRRALEEMVERRPRDEWDAFALKREYLDFLRFLEGLVDSPLEQIEEEMTYRVGDYQLPTELSVRLHRAKRRLRREPERSRRVVRLLFANWLAQVEPLGQRPRRPAVLARLRAVGQTSAVLLYPVGPEAPTGARALSPQEVASWLVTTNDARLALSDRNGWSLWPSVRQRERAAYRELLVLLAGELFRREREAPPPTEDTLVGTYLQSLRDDGSAELADGTTPIVE